mgnify:FL=1
MASIRDADVLGLKLKKLADIERYHDVFVDKVEKRYNSYRGVLKENSDAAQWRSRAHPPYSRNTVETFVANLVEDSLHFDVIPRSVMGNAGIDPLTLLDGAEAGERLLNYHLEIDRFKEKQRALALQAAITGLTVLKVFWNFEERNGRTIQDNPGMAVVDVRDFIFPPNSQSIEKMPYCFHRVWKSLDELKDLEKKGVYKNISQLGEEGLSGGSGRGGHEEELFGYERTRGLIEVLEYWAPQSTCTIAKRQVVIQSPRDNPFNFDHLGNRYPFEGCSSMPDLFRIPGMGEIELLSDIQEMIWDFMNQRHDNAKLSSSAIIMMRSDLEDLDAYRFAPGEKWQVDDPAQIKWFEPNPQVSRGLIESESMLRGDMQQVTGGLPLLSGAENIDQKTATGVSIVTSLAQRLLVAKKQQFMWAYERMAEKWLAMSSQFLSGSTLLPIIGEDGARTFLEVFPPDDATKFRVKIRPTSESALRQERRAEAQSLLQVATQMAPLLQMAGTPLNLKAFVEDLLDAFDKDTRERYFSQLPQMQMGGGPPGAPGGQPAGVTEPGTGFSSPQAVSPLAPSNPTSMSPEVFLQQLAAMGGGGTNV